MITYWLVPIACCTGTNTNKHIYKHNCPKSHTQLKPLSCCMRCTIM